MKKISIILLFTLSLLACRKEETPLPFTATRVTEGMDGTEVKGFYLLNEGNMGSNKASLDCFDYRTGIYYKNIFAQINPDVAMELGDVGNDLQIYRERLYAVINCSNLVEVMDAATARHIGRIAIPNCRYIVFDGDFGYVSSYAGPVGPDPDSRPGKIVKIDLETLETVAEATVGYQPEQMVIMPRNGGSTGNKLYAANSGGYRGPEYDNRVSVIDLGNFQVMKEIQVGMNPQKMICVGKDKILVSCTGDYNEVPAQAYIISSARDEVTGHYPGLGISGMTLFGDEIYAYCKDWTGHQETSYLRLDVSDLEAEPGRLIADGSEKMFRMPYCIASNPENGEFIITDAKDFVTPGQVHCYSPDGKLKWSARTGDIPGHIAFSTIPIRLEQEH